MKIRGLSYQNGIFFIGEKIVACAFENNGEIHDWVKPLTATTILQMGKQVFLSMPSWFKFLTLIYFLLIFLPKLLAFFGVDIGWNGLPYYFIIYYMFGTHFTFPGKLKKFHGAEHKVFSDRGVKRRSRLFLIRRAKITNRFCSTNSVVIYFSSVFLLVAIGLFFFPLTESVAMASYASLLFIPIIQMLMKWFKPIRWYVLTVSYWLQEKWTTAEPERVHLLTAIQSYARLAETEFPEHFNSPNRVKEVKKKMAIVDITIIPVGTKDTNLSEYVADIHRLLETYEDKITYQLTPMSTIIEGELSVLFEVIQAMHEVPFKSGIERVTTNIRIDDRRDKIVKMEDKVKAVREKLKNKEEQVSE